MGKLGCRMVVLHDRFQSSFLFLIMKTRRQSNVAELKVFQEFGTVISNFLLKNSRIQFAAIAVFDLSGVSHSISAPSGTGSPVDTLSKRNHDLSPPFFMLQISCDFADEGTNDRRKG
jgi:hypothetical protein